MKWEACANKAERRIARLLTRVAGIRGFYTLLVLAALVLLTGASEKWTN